MSQGSEVPRKPGWVLDELATAGRENLDPAHASQYDRKEDARAAEEVQLLVDLDLDQTKDVVGVGAGTGQFAAAAADVSNRVIAVGATIDAMGGRLGRPLPPHRVVLVFTTTAAIITEAGAVRFAEGWDVVEGAARPHPPIATTRRRSNWEFQ